MKKAPGTPGSFGINLFKRLAKDAFQNFRNSRESK